MLKSPQKILLVNGLQVGDIVLTMPVIKALKERFPESKLACLIRRENEDIVRGFPYVDDVIGYHKGDPILPVVRRIWKYDIALCIDFKYRSAVLPFFARIPVRAGLRHKRGLFMTHAIDRDPLEEEIYQPINYAGIIERSAGIKLDLDDELYIASPTGEQSAKIDEIWKQFDKPVIAIAPFTSTPRKEWPINLYNELIPRLKSALNCQIVILGGPKEISRNITTDAVSLVGKTSLLEMAEVIRRSKLFIGCCSAPLHIAAVLKTPIVAIYGSSSPKQWAPPGATVLYNKFDCSPCIGKPVECDTYSCMNSISVDDVYKAVQGLYI